MKKSLHSFCSQWRILPTAMLLCLASAWQAHGEGFVYTVEPIYYRDEGSGIRIEFNVRKNGESYIVAQYLVPENSKWRKTFEDAWRRFAKEEVFFEFVLFAELPRGKTFFLPHLDIMTEQVRQDIAKLSRNRPDSPTIRETDVLSIKEISENDHLGIKPKYVTPNGE